MTFSPIPHRIEALVRTAIQNAQNAGALPAAESFNVPVSRTKNSAQGHYGVACMALAKSFGMKPLDIANLLQNHLPSDPMIGKTETFAPGFLNFHLSDAWVIDQLGMITREGMQVFQQNMGEGKRVMVEFVSANPTGPIHIGRTRGGVVGDSIARLMEACGWQVHREYYFNNGGRQMQMLGETLKIRYLQQLGETLELEADHYQGEYLVDMAKDLVAANGEGWRDEDWLKFKEYAEKQIFKLIEQTLLRINIKFDNFFNELTVYEDGTVWKVAEMLTAAGHTYQSATREGANEEEVAEATAKNYKPATWFRSTSFGDVEDRVIIRSNEDPTYVLPDVAYHLNKYARGFDRMIDIFGSDHFTEAQTVNRALQALGYDASKVDVVLMQWVHLVRGNETVTMSTRKGQYVTLDDLVDEVGSDAIRYFMLNRSADSSINFDLDLAVKKSNDNPVFYIQNAHVRCAGILRQLEARGFASDWDKDADLTLLNQEEREFILKMLELPDILHLAYSNLAPHQIAAWSHDFARAFHPLYEKSRVLGDVPEDIGKARLQLYRAAKVVFQRVLDLMGMSAPEEM